MIKYTFEIFLYRVAKNDTIGYTLNRYNYIIYIREDAWEWKEKLHLGLV